MFIIESVISDYILLYKWRPIRRGNFGERFTALGSFPTFPQNYPDVIHDFRMEILTACDNPVIFA